MINPEHPDIMFYYSYNDGEERIHLHIAPLETEDFSHGLDLAWTFTNMGAAKHYAIKVQAYLDAWKKEIIDEHI